MAYFQLSDLAGIIPSEFLTQALDDTNSGQINQALFNQIAQDVSDVIDGYLGTRFAVPFQTNPVTGLYPPFVFNAAKKLCAEQLYKRRGITDDKNPWSAECSQLRTMMKAMALGDAPLDPSINREDPTASIITQPMRTAHRRHAGDGGIIFFG